MGSSLLFYTALKQLEKKAMCCMWAGTKSMTEKITEGTACGRAKKTGVFGKIPFKYNLLILPNIWVFCPVERMFS
jgi:hypothetical protein